MKRYKLPIAAALLAATALAGTPAAADTVLRLDEVAVGELDPAKATDYADSILMFNVYDTLVLPCRRPRLHAASRRELGGRRYRLHL